MPNFLGILTNSTVRGELGGRSHVLEALAAEGHAVGIVPVGAELGIQIGFVVQQQPVLVGVFAPVQQRVEQVAQAIIGRHSAIHQRVDSPAEIGIAVVDAARIVGTAAGVDLLNRVAEDILVFHSCFLGNLHVGAVQSSQRHSAIEHQLHVAGAGSFRAGRGNLLRNIGGGDDVLGVGAVVVLNKDHLDLVRNSGIVVDHPSHTVDVADDGLCVHIAGGGLCAENEHGGIEVGQAALLQAEINVHNGQNIHQLALVQVQALDLNIKHEVRIQHDSLMLGDDIAQLLLLLSLDGVDLKFTDGALKAIADLAIQRNMGARGLRTIIENSIMDIMYETPSEEDIESVEVTKDVITKHAKPRVVRKNSDDVESSQVSVNDN